MLAAYETVFAGLHQLGPHDAGLTRRIAESLRPLLRAQPRVIDMGCGAGAASLVLAEVFEHGRVLALDQSLAFVEATAARAAGAGLDGRLVALQGDMREPPSLDGRHGDFDLIWSESSIYGLGRAQALACWRPLLAAHGRLVFSDLVWLQPAARRPRAALEYWAEAYPALAEPEAVEAEIGAAGWHHLGTTRASAAQAWEAYYQPLQPRIAALRGTASGDPALASVLDELATEIDMQHRFAGLVGPAFFQARPDTGGDDAEPADAR